MSAALPVVAWVALTPNGNVAYFDGKPMVMCGPVGNHIHPDALTTLAAAQERIDALTVERDQLRKDAERYRALREFGSQLQLYLYDDEDDPTSGDWRYKPNPAVVDAAVDESLRKFGAPAATTEGLTP